MRVIALLSWYDENPSWLAELTASLARAGVDHLVAVDGAYALYPDGKGSSPSEQAEAIAAAAAEAGIGVTIRIPFATWAGNEVEKRTALFALGHQIAEPDIDWLFVIDADEIVQSGHLRGGGDDFDVAEVLLVDEYGGHHPERRLFRAQDGGIVVVHHHGRYEDGETGWALRDSCNSAAQVPADQAWTVKVRHRAHERDEDRDLNRRAYYAARKGFQAEVAPCF